MIFGEMNMGDKVEGDISFLVDIYRRGRTLEGLTPWSLSRRIAVTANSEAWTWYYDEGTGWEFEEKIKASDFAFSMSEWLLDGPEFVRAEVSAYVYPG